MFNVIHHEKLNQFVTKLHIVAPLIAKKAQAGQFVMVRVNDTGEKIPLTISDSTENSITLIFQKVGKTTFLLDKLRPGDKILDITGPLGSPTELDNYKNVITIGGGLGVAIMYSQIKRLRELKSHVESIIGFRNKDMIILEHEINKIANKLDIVTDDGSYGKLGLVTDLLKEKLVSNYDKYDLVLVVGPLLMMKAVCDITRHYKIKTIVSMNTIMTDGTGMCGSCRLTVDKKIKFACVDGPDFDGHLVNFDEIILKNRMYVVQEEESMRIMKNKE